MLNKVIDVIENLRDDCRKEVLKPFYRVSKNYFDIIHVSSLSAAYCWLLKNKKWEGEIRFIWLPFFFNVKNEYKLTLEILKNKDKFNDLLVDKNKLTSIVESIVASINTKLDKISFPYQLDISFDFPTSSKTHPLFRLIFNTKGKKLIEFKEDDQIILFTAIYESLGDVIKAIDTKYP